LPTGAVSTAGANSQSPPVRNYARVVESGRRSGRQGGAGAVRGSGQRGVPRSYPHRLKSLALRCSSAASAVPRAFWFRKREGFPTTASGGPPQLQVVGGCQTSGYDPPLRLRCTNGRAQRSPGL